MRRFGTVFATTVALTLALSTVATAADEFVPLDPEQYSLEGKTIGVAVVGTQHFWDREAFQGAVAEIERLGGTALTTDGGRDNTVHAQNHDVFLAQGVDGVITILGDDAVEPKLQALKDAGIPVVGVDHTSDLLLNNTQSDSDIGGTAAGELMAKAIGGQGNVAVFNAFSEALGFCGIRYDSWKKVLEEQYPDITILQPELAEEFANAPEDARQQTLTLLEKYPEGELQAIHVACWDQPAIGVVQGLEEAGRTEVVVSAFDAGPDTLEIMMEEGSPFKVNVAQQPRLIATVAADNLARYLYGEEIPKDTYLDVFPVDGPDGASEVYETLGYDQ
jgi:ribose transport system substrate-binding protein